METIKFEAIKTGLRQSKDGYSLTLVVHPDDLPDDLMRDFVGSRYMVVMVRLGDDEQPLIKVDSGDTSVSVAGMLCRDPNFWEFLYEQELLMEKGENACVDWLHSYLDIDSRSELKINTSARDLFNQLRKSFEAWKKLKES